MLLRVSPRTEPDRLLSRPTHRRARTNGIFREITWLIGLFALYQSGRLFGGHDIPAAFAHARRILRLEHWLHLPAEQHLQTILLEHETLARAANTFYATAHLPVTALSLLWLLLYRPDTYRRTRWALLTATGISLVIYLLLPVAPPRMLPGFTDLAALHGQSVYSSDVVANQHAAMPSLHVGWAVLIAIAMITANHTRWRWLWLIHPTITTLVVVGTGNHYWLDALAGATLILIAFAATATAHSTSATLLTDREPPAVIDLRATPAPAKPASAWTTSRPAPAPASTVTSRASAQRYSPQPTETATLPIFTTRRDRCY